MSRNIVNLLKILLVVVLIQNLLIAKELSDMPPDVQAAIERCSECHGLHGEKSALHRSIPINKLSKEAFLGRLRGYMKLTYGGELKAFMRSRIAYLNKRQLTQIAEYYTKEK